MKKRVLNLYAGLGGNRKLWENVQVTAVEINEDAARLYASSFPADEIVIGDARKYLVENFSSFDFIWSSPPCQTHSRAGIGTPAVKPRYPDLRLYEQVIFLDTFFAGKWVVENVNPYYKPLLNPQKVGRHCFWSNFYIPDFDLPALPGGIKKANTTIGLKALSDWLGIDYSSPIKVNGKDHPEQALKNCVHPALGLHIFQAAYFGTGKIF